MQDKFKLDRIDDLVRWLACGMLMALPFSVGALNLFGYLILLLTPFSRLWRQSIPRLIKNRLVLVSLFMLVVVMVGVWDSSGPIHEALNTFNRYHKLIFIPLLIPFFQQAQHRQRALIGFLIAVSVNMLISWTEYLGMTHWGDPVYYAEPFHPGDAVFRQHITQGLLFDLLLVVSGIFAVLTGGWKRAFFIVLSALTALDILVVMVGRTGKALLPIILLWLLVEWWRLNKAQSQRRHPLTGVILAGLLILGGTLWSVFNPSTMLGTVINEVKLSQSTGMETSQGERIQFWKKGMILIQQNPWYGSGAGSVHEQTARLAQREKTAVARLATYNLHNELLMWTVQFGLPGLLAIILFYFFYFSAARGKSLAHCVLRGAGLVFVLGSLFNSFLIDFTEGYSMVLLAGVLADL